jgi:hypothetical protein
LRKAFADASGSVTVRSFGEKWIVGRKGNTSCVDDEQRLDHSAAAPSGD